MSLRHDPKFRYGTHRHEGRPVPPTARCSDLCGHGCAVENLVMDLLGYFCDWKKGLLGCPFRYYFTHLYNIHIHNGIYKILYIIYNTILYIYIYSFMFPLDIVIMIRLFIHMHLYFWLISHQYCIHPGIKHGNAKSFSSMIVRATSTFILFEGFSSHIWWRRVNLLKSIF